MHKAYLKCLLVSFSNLVTYGKFSGVPISDLDAQKDGWQKIDSCNGMMRIVDMVFYGKLYQTDID